MMFFTDADRKDILKKCNIYLHDAKKMTNFKL